MLEPIHFVSDHGPACMCRGTIYGYRVSSPVSGPKVDVQCYTCHAVDFFYPDFPPFTAAECSAQHRASKES